MRGVQVAVLPGGAGRAVVAGPAPGGHAERLRVQLAAFVALGLYGILRWATLLGGASTGRLVGLLVLGTGLAAGGALLAEWSRWLAGLAFFIGALAALAISGLPVSWIVHIRVAVSGRAVGQGLGALPNASVPYSGLNEWVRVVILLGAALLLLGAAAVLTFVPRRLGQLRLAGAALPLMALSVIPATAIRPGLPYLEGVLLFGLLVAFVWAQRIERRRLGGVIALCGLAAAIAAGVAPSLDRHRAWINYRSLAASLAPGGVETFNWTQGYGRLHWPHTGVAVLEVQARHPDYWKAENLDVFDGQGWVAARTPEAVSWQTGVSRSALARWTQTIQVTLDSMATNQVIAAGSAYPPRAGVGPAVATGSSGTWESTHRMGPGASYRVRVYAPHPSAAQLGSAGAGYPGALARSYLSMVVPELPGLSGSSAFRYPGSGVLEQVVFAPFDPRQSQPLEAPASVASVLASSPYAQAYALAQRLKRGSATPYAYVRRVERYLAEGYRYSQTPPSSRYPLEDFLFVHRLGYCQHFAGAMALLLRMGGVPARLAVGFTPGTFDTATHRWVVSDLGAHAWVEVWFPHYGWVRFDPTPGADPALKDNSPHTASGSGAAAIPGPVPRQRDIGGPASRPNRLRPRSTVSRSSGLPLAVLGPLFALVLGLGLVLTRARANQDPVRELARAFARTGRPLAVSATLSALEGRVAHVPEAAGYVRALRLARYGAARPPGAAVPGLEGRRAVRRALGAGLGPVGRARAWWALPPRWRWPS
jgi:transglutaminase-like putative cysteine protease